jgi:hypothetical protein
MAPFFPFFSCRGIQAELQLFADTLFSFDDDEAVDDAVREPVTVEGAASRNFFARMTTPRFESGLQQFVLVPQHQRSEELVPSQGVIVLNPLSYTFSNQQPCL